MQKTTSHKLKLLQVEVFACDKSCIIQCNVSHITQFTWLFSFFLFSMGVPSHQYSEKGHFYDTGIDNINGFAVNGKWRMKRLERIMKELNHTEKHIDYMKMDVEFNEWTALYDIIKSGLASRIRQLAVEFHTPEMDIHVNPTHKCTWTKHETLAAMLTVLHGLRNEGFSVYYSSINYRTQFISLYSQQQQYCCYNVHLVNTKHPMNAWRPPPPGRRQRH